MTLLVCTQNSFASVGDATPCSRSLRLQERPRFCAYIMTRIGNQFRYLDSVLLSRTENTIPEPML